LIRSLAAAEVEVEVVEELLYEEQGVRVVGQPPWCRWVGGFTKARKVWMKDMESRSWLKG
jgi:hypothetical protein